MLVIAIPLVLKVHREPLCEQAHVDLAHRIRGLAAEEAAVDRRADDDDAPAASTVT